MSKLFVRGKKASLSLSMEAIVILILAVVMLGLGLTFVRGMFSNITTRADNALDVADLAAKPSEGEPITLTPKSPDIKEGNSAQVQLGFYNPDPAATRWVMKLYDEQGNVCLSGDACTKGSAPAGINILYNANNFTLEKDQTVGYNLIMDAETGAVLSGASTPYLVTVRICGTTSASSPTCDGAGEIIHQKEIFVTVRK